MQAAACKLPRGLGLLETTIAIGVIVTGLFAAFTLVLANARAIDVASFRLGASQAAREGIEVVRAIRDSNWLADRAWHVGLVGHAASHYAIATLRTIDGAWELVFGVDDFSDARSRMVHDASSAFWTQGRGADAEVVVTPYRRILTLDPICEHEDGAREVLETGDCPETQRKIGIRVRSTVHWTVGGQESEVIAEEQLFDWR